MEAELAKTATIVELAHNQLQAGDYSNCLLTLSVLDQAQSLSDSHLQAMMAICNIHRFASLKQWSKVS